MKVKKYRIEGNSIYCCRYLISFCTKYKRKVLDSEKIIKLKEIFLEIAKEYDIKIEKIDISSFQVTMKIECSPQLGIKTAITKFKNISATKMKELYPELSKRIPSIWTRESSIGTIGDIDEKQIEKFLKLQKKYETYDINKK